ncbi:MAG: hypothetical protein M1840_003960 [Geoglossum simile]|nr:MAG: hypothetical protein M1840_003960 [Geoglossum simile]
MIHGDKDIVQGMVILLRAAIIDVDKANAGEDTGESVGEDEDEDKDEDEYQDASEYAREDKEGGEDEDFIQYIIEDELEDEAEKDKDMMIYLSIWKAMVNNKEMEILDNIKNKLLDEDWNLDTLCDERKGGAMTTAIWESYGFKLGTLANIRSKLSEFK